MSARVPTAMRTRRGAALRLVLVALVLGVAAATVAAQALSTRLLAERTREGARIAERAVDAALVPVEEWLRTGSARVVLPPDAESPAVAVLDHAIALDGRTVRVRATAFDERGMLAWGLARGSGALAGALPSDVRSRLAAADLRKGEQAGLDLIAKDASRARFPPQLGSAALSFGGATSDRARTDATDAVAIGALVATHGDDDPAINVNTAPLELLRRADRLAQRDVADAVAQARAGGRRFDAIPPAPGRDGNDPASAGPRLVAESDLWAVRVDANAGGASSAWWTVWRRGERGWSVAQRIRITE